MQLHRWLDKARRGERQIVFVTGEPGIGKTTVVDAFLTRLADEHEHEHELWIGRGQCIEHYGAGEAYLPLLEALGRLGRESGGQRLIELLSHLTKGLELLKTQSDTPERTLQELLLQTTLGPALTATKGHAAPEVGTIYTRARELCQQVGESPQLFTVLMGLRRFYSMRAELQTAHELDVQCLRLAQRAQDPALLLEAHRALGVSLYQVGELALAREHLEQGFALYDPQQHRFLALRYGNDPGAACLSFTACTLWLLGSPDQALQRSREALTFRVLRQHVRWKPGKALAHQQARICSHRDNPRGVSMNDKERLLALFCQGVCHPQASGFEVLELLDSRSALARWEEELTAEQRKELEEADGLFLTNVGQFYENVAQVANLQEMRQRAAVPPSHWWWYLEKLVRAERAAL